MKIKLKDVQNKGDRGYNYTSLAKLTGQRIVDIEGYISMEFGDPVFDISRIVLGNGKTLNVGGEHDIAYVEDIDKDLNLDDDTLLDLYYQENPEEKEADEDGQ